MSKPVRVRGDVAAQVDERARFERRSFANMVEVLLLEALGGAPAVAGYDPIRQVFVEPKVGAAVESVPAAVHNQPMEQAARDLATRDGRCHADTPRGTKCKLCGKVHS